MGFQDNNSSNVVTGLCLALNFGSSIAIIIINKWVFEFCGFTFGTALTVLHFVVTYLCLLLCGMLEIFKIKHLEILNVAPLSALFCGYVVFTNLSLQHNTIGFYQVMKVLTTPAVVIFQAIYYKQHFTLKIKALIAVICVGVAIASASDIEINFFGTVYALIGVALSALYQVMIGKFQKDLDANSMQLLLYQAPIAVVMLIPFIPIFDNVRGLLSYNYNAYSMFMVFLSSFAAFLVNLSIFLVISKTSAVTYNVAGHFKMSIILASGFLIFHEEAEPLKITGILIVMFGVIGYTHIKLQHPTPQSPKIKEDIIQRRRRNFRRK